MGGAGNALGLTVYWSLDLCNKLNTHVHVYTVHTRADVCMGRDIYVYIYMFVFLTVFSY